jgi:hypothetical protein
MEAIDCSNSHAQHTAATTAAAAAATTTDTAVTALISQAIHAKMSSHICYVYSSNTKPKKQCTTSDVSE